MKVTDKILYQKVVSGHMVAILNFFFLKFIEAHNRVCYLNLKTIHSMIFVYLALLCLKISHGCLRQLYFDIKTKKNWHYHLKMNIYQ